MGRPATGSPRWNSKEKRWEARISLPGVGRPPVPMEGIPPCSSGTPLAKGHDCPNCSKARDLALLISNKARAKGAVPVETAETWNEWHPRYLDTHQSLGKQVREMKGAGRKWVSDRIGATPMTALTREQIVGVRDDLTRAVQVKEISAKRAMNVWSDLIAAPFSRAFTDDDPRYSAVRVGPAASNPAMGIKPPVTKAQLDEDKRERQGMHPNEFLLFITCVAIPVVARRIAAIALYLYCRPQELFAIRWPDVDWEAQEIRIRRKLDVRTGEEKPGAKSDAGIREVPIHKNLMPLLVAMYEERESDDARIIPLIGSARLFERFADQTRQYIKLAGIARRELVDGSDDVMPFDFRSWRTTGCTWLAMLGTDSYVIAQQAGHKSPDTTWGSYIKRGPDLRQRHGEPFPTLPAELFSGTRVLAGFGSGTKNSPKSSGKPAERAGFEPKPEPARIDSEIAKNAANPAAIAIESVPSVEPVMAGSLLPKPILQDRSSRLRAMVRRALDDGDDGLAAELMTLLQASAPAHERKQAFEAAPVVDLATRLRRR